MILLLIYADTSGDAISVHLRDYFEVPDKPKWSDIASTMQQFSNLYPIMSKYLVDLGSREAVLERADILIFAFSQEITSPMYMPVTRDLSENKRKTILAYLKSKGKYDEEHPGVGIDPASISGAQSPDEEPENASEIPSDFHQQLIDNMKAKMGREVSYEAVEDLTKL